MNNIRNFVKSNPNISLGITGLGCIGVGIDASSVGLICFGVGILIMTGYNAINDNI